MNNVRRGARAIGAIAFCLSLTVASRADAIDPRAELYFDPSPAYAAPIEDAGRGGVVAGGPSCGALTHRIVDGPVWLGHFQGGNIGPQSPVPGGVDWRDVYACFQSEQSCHSWLRDMRVNYRAIEGYRACVTIR